MALRSIALPSLLTAGLLVSGCRGSGTEVVIDTRVGDDRAKSELERARMTATALAEAGRTWWETREQRRPTTVEAGDAVVEQVIHYDPVPPEDADAFAAQLAALRDGPLDEVGMITRNLAEAGPATWPLIRDELLAARKHGKREYKQILDVIGGDVPNRYGYFDRAWKKAHGYDVRLSTDWFEDLLGLAPARISTPVRPVYRETLLTVALLRAAGKIAREDRTKVGEIVGVLLDVAYVHDGTFRDEVGRAVDSIGDLAIPHLLRESVVPDGADPDDVPARRAAYATYCLDRMDRLHPSRAIEAASDDRLLLADVLDAYALVRHGEAAPLLLDRIDADAPGVRRAARKAFEAYVVGPAPQVRRKAIRLFGGNTSTQRAELSYREHARLAIRDKLAREAPELLEPECELWLPGGLIEPTCEGQPERLFRAWVERLDRRRASRRDMLVAQALSTSDHLAGTAILDGLLTDGGDPIEPDLLAPYYVEVASELEQSGETEQAAALLRKSAMLLAEADPARARELTVDALVLESRTEGLDERGRMMLLGTAKDLDQGGPDVDAAIGEVEAQQHESSHAMRMRLMWMLVAVLAVLGVLWWIGSALHRPRAIAAT